MKPEEVGSPTPEQMTVALLKAARAGRWNHWQHEVKTHASDWVEAEATRKPLTNVHIQIRAIVGFPD